MRSSARATTPKAAATASRYVGLLAQPRSLQGTRRLMDHAYYRDVKLRTKLIARYDALEPDIPGGVGPGWHPIVGEAALALDAIVPGWRCSQVKEKFGLLRVYVSAQRTSFEMFYTTKAIAAYARLRSSGICEACGDHGSLRESGWIKTLCDVHFAEREAGGRPIVEAKP